MDPVIEKASEQLERELDLLCQKAEAIGAAIGVVRDGELVWTHGYGFNDLDGDDALASDTLFWIASITKPFTETAIFMLQQRGLLSIETRSSRIFRSSQIAFRARAKLRPIQVRGQLWEHELGSVRLDLRPHILRRRLGM